MPVEVILPKVDMDMVDGSIEAWKVAEGDTVAEGQLLFEIGTNKAVMEVESPAAGVIRKISAKQGETVAVGTVVAWIYAATEAFFEPTAPNRAVAAPEKPVELTLVKAAASVAPAHVVTALRATPLARRIARQKGVDLAVVAGSGPRGRINERDVTGYLSQAAAPAIAPVQISTRPVAVHVDASSAAGSFAGELVPFSAVRRIVAKRLTESATTIPHFYVSVSMDMGGAMAFLKRVSPIILAKTGVKPSMTTFLVHAVARALEDHPFLNASVEGDAARLHPARHIGVAMDRDGDLVVPVVRNAGRGPFVETVLEFDRLRQAVQNRTLKPSEMEGGTFTISNLGMFGVDTFTAIINPPQTGILSVGKTVQTPCAIDNAVVIRPKATLCLSSDHRVVDGVAAAKFMADLQRLIEMPELLA